MKKTITFTTDEQNLLDAARELFAPFKDFELKVTQSRALRIQASLVEYNEKMQKIFGDLEKTNPEDLKFNPDFINALIKEMPEMFKAHLLMAPIHAVNATFQAM